MPLSNEERDQLTVVLQHEYGVIFALGVIKAYANGGRWTYLDGESAEHRARRDALVDVLQQQHLPVPLEQAGYQLPSPVTNEMTAAQLALRCEEQTTRVFRAAIERIAQSERRELCFSAIVESTMRTAYWRQALRIDPIIDSLPGAVNE